MSWYSLLPPQLTSLESWLVRFFLILGTLTIGPWLFLILYDIILYIWRAATYEIPVIGGRARGRRKPRAPSLSERGGREGDNGFGGDGAGGGRRRRAWSLGVIRDISGAGVDVVEGEDVGSGGAGRGNGREGNGDGESLVRRKTMAGTR